MDDQKPTKENENKSVLRKYSSEEVKKILLDLAKFEGELYFTLKKLGEETMAQFMHGNEKEKQAAHEKLAAKLPELMIAMSFETQWDIVDTFIQEYRGLAKEFTQQLMKEYDCTTPSEKALATLTANAYIRTIDNSKRLNNELGLPGTTITENKTKYLLMMSKQIDRAHRQFISSLTTLKQIKSPPIEMNIRTNNAFISQNQQINADYPPNSTKNENNEAE